MKTISKFNKIIFIMGLITLTILWFYLINTKCNPKQPEVIITKTTIKKHIARKNMIPDTFFTDPEIIIKAKLIKDTLYIKDTIYRTSDIVIDYFAYKVYIDSLLNDSTGLIVIRDSIFMNSLFRRNAEIEIYNYTKTIHKKDVLSVSAGGFIFYTPICINNVCIGIRANLAVKKNSFGVGIGTNKTYIISYERLIFEK